MESRLRVILAERVITDMSRATQGIQVYWSKVQETGQ